MSSPCSILLGRINIRHPWRSYWRRRALEHAHRWILPIIESYARSLTSEKTDITQAEQRVLEVAQISRGCSMLILAECAEQGLICKKKECQRDLSPGAKELSRYLNVELKALAMLDLERPVCSEPDVTGSVVFYIPEKGAIAP